MAQTPTEGSQKFVKVGVTQAAEDAWHTPAVDLRSVHLRSRLPPKPHDELQQGILNTVAMQAAVVAQAAGADPEEASARMHHLGLGKETSITSAVTGALGDVTVGAGSALEALPETKKVEAANEERQKRIDGIGAMDRFSAAFQAATVTSALAHRLIQNSSFGDAKMTGPDFYQWYDKNRADIEGGRSEDEISSLRESTNDADLHRIQFDLQADKDYWNTVTKEGTASTASTFGYSMTAGLFDPVGWVAGAGVGKVAQLVGVGSRAALAAGKVGKSFAYAAGENAVGNVLTEAALDAAGKHVSNTDYLNAAGAGLVFGAALHSLQLPGRRSPETVAGNDDVIAETGADLRRQAAESNHNLYTEAQERAGPGAPVESIVRHAEIIETERGQAVIDALDLPVQAHDTLPVNMSALQEESAPLAPAQTKTYVLPPELSKATPSYGYKDKQFKLDFANDVDRAAYIIAQEKPSKRDADYLQFVMNATGADEQSARNYGKVLRATIKAQAKDAEPGRLTVEALFQKPKESAATNNGSGESAASVEAQNRLRDEKAAGQTRMLIDRDGSVRELTGVDAVDTHARPGQVIVQRGVGKDEWTVLSHGDDIGKDAVAGKVNAARARMQESSVADDVETPVGEYFLDMDEDSSILDLSSKLQQREELEDSALLDSTRRRRLQESRRSVVKAGPELNALSIRLARLEEAGADHTLGQVPGYGLVRRGIEELRAKLELASDELDPGDEAVHLANAQHIISELREYNADRILAEAERKVFPADNVVDLPKRTIHAEQEAPLDSSVQGDVLVADRERAVTLGGGSGDESQLFPRVAVGTGDEARPILTSPEAIAAAAQKHNLDIEISNEGQRAQVAELVERADRIVAENPINEEALKTMLKRVGGESVSNTLLSAKSSVLRAWSIITLENPQGAAGRRATASLTKETRERAYMQNSSIEFHNAYTAYRNARGGNRFADFFNRRLYTQFNREVAEAMEHGRMGKDLSGIDPNVKLAMDTARAMFKRAGDDQIFVGTLGAARLENIVQDAYYLPRRFSPEAVASLTNSPAMKRAYLRLLSKNMQENAGYDAPFANKLSLQYLERLKLRAAGAYSTAMSPTDLGGHEVLKDALEAMNLSREEVQEALHKYARGGATHTKERIPLNLLTEMEGDGGKRIRLLDLASTDITGLMRSYARRVSGEVALAKHGIMGQPGIKLVAQGALAQGATPHEMKAFWQTAAEFLGDPVGGKRSKWGDNLLAFTSAIRMGGMGITQLNDYSNGVIALGAKHAYAGVPAMRRLRKEVLALAKGERIENSMLDSFSKYGLDFGVEGYTMHGLLDVNSEFETSGAGSLTTLDRMIRFGNNANRIASAHRAIVSVQIRGMAEQIIQRFVEKVKDGHGTVKGGTTVHDAALLDMGFTPEVVTAFKKDMNRIVKIKEDGGMVFDMDEFSDTDNALRFMQAVQRGATQIVQEPHIGENNAWVHHEYLRFLTQFRHFSLLSMEKQWGRQKLVHGTGSALGYMMGAMSVAVPIHFARVYVTAAGMSEEKRQKYLDERLSFVAVARATMNYAGATGILPDIVDVTAAGLGVPTTGGRWGGSSNSFLGTVAPAAGALDDLWKGTQSAGRVTGRLISGKSPQWGLEAANAMHLFPGARLPYLQGAVNLLKN